MYSCFTGVCGRFIAQGTIEEKIYNRQLYKQQLAKMSESTEQQERIFNADDFMGLDNLLSNTTAEATSVTQQTINSARAQQQGCVRVGRLSPDAL